MFYKFLLSVIFLFFLKANAQYFKNEINELLESSYFRGLIFYPTELMNYTLKDYSNFFEELNSKKSLLNNHEKHLLEIYSDFLKGINNNQKLDTLFNFLNFTKTFLFFRYHDKNFSILINPIYSIEFGKYYNENIFIRRSGFFIFGRLFENFSYFVSFDDNYEKGKNLDITKRYTRESGIIITKSSKNSIEYDNISGGLTYHWDYGKFSLAKDKIIIGSGNFGNLILSDKYPSFPFINFEFTPVKWFKFFYLHGILKSNLIDSTSIRYEPLSKRYSMTEIPKYFVLHSISLYPTKELSILLGESVVYSERFQPIYFIPVLFFRATDHYLAQNLGSSTGNAQFFADFSYLIRVLNSKFYSTLFVDELSITKLLKGKSHIHYGVTTGVEFRNLFFPLDNLVIEYSRISPFTYNNSVLSQVYSTNDIKMGHWIESNADLLSFSYRFFLRKNLKLKFDLWSFRKGKTESISEQYSNFYPPTLYGDRRNEFGINLIANYNFLSNLSLKLEYLYTNISDEELERTYKFKEGKKSSLRTSISILF